MLRPDIFKKNTIYLVAPPLIEHDIARDIELMELVSTLASEKEQFFFKITVYMWLESDF